MSFWELVWGSLVILVFVMFLMTFISVMIDVFRRHDISGWAKAGWIIVLIVLPIIGVLIYVVVYGQGMAERSYREGVAQAEAIVAAGGGGSPADQIAVARDLLANGAITQEEYEMIKKQVLS